MTVMLLIIQSLQRTQTRELIDRAHIITLNDNIIFNLRKNHLLRVRVSLCELNISTIFKTFVSIEY